MFFKVEGAIMDIVHVPWFDLISLFILLLDTRSSAHPPLQGADVNENIKITQSADANVNAQDSSAASTYANSNSNIKFM